MGTGLFSIRYGLRFILYIEVYGGGRLCVGDNKFIHAHQDYCIQVDRLSQRKALICLLDYDSL